VKRIDGTFTRGRPNLGYGMTETNAYGPGNSGDDYVAQPTSTGRVVPGIDLRVVDPDGVELPCRRGRRDLVPGPHLIRGYWNRPDATGGDDRRRLVAHRRPRPDRRRGLRLRGRPGQGHGAAGRRERVLRRGRGGHLRAPDVHEAAVFGIPHERLGEEVAAAVMPKPGRTIDPEDLRLFLNGRIASYKVPTVVSIHAEALPRNASGKILKRELRDALVAEQS
jgi:long-chain acyl-CoA synthetase